jgi:hypothetical protein
LARLEIIRKWEIRGRFNWLRKYVACFGDGYYLLKCSKEFECPFIGECLTELLAKGGSAKVEQ